MTSQSFTATAGQTDFQVTFGFISQAHLTVFVDGLEETNWSLINGDTVQLASPLLLDQEVLISRETPLTALLVDFQAGAGARRRELDLAFRQLLYAQQEITSESVVGIRKNGAGTAWQAEALPIKDMGTPSDASDAATKAYVDTAVAGDGILPTPVVADIGKGIRVRSGPSYAIASVSPAFSTFKTPVATSGLGGYDEGFTVITNSWGPAWNTRDETRVPFAAEYSYLDPDGGTITLDPNTFDILIPRGKFFIEVFGIVRSLTTGTSTSLLDAQIDLGTDLGVSVDQTKVLQLGAPGGATDPPSFTGLPSFSFGASVPVYLFAYVDHLTTTTYNVRAKTQSAGGEVVLDVPFRVRVTEVPQ